MKAISKFMIFVFIMFAGFAISTGCKKEEGTFEKMGRKTDEALQKTTQDVKEKTENSRIKVKKMTKEAAERARKEAEERSN